jgi:hypothetical protein
MKLVHFDAHARTARVADLDVVKHAMSNNNPAVAASVLLGIHESFADSKLKNWLFIKVAQSWAGGLDGCLDVVSSQLGRHGRAAEDSSAWVEARVGSVRDMKRAYPLSA